MRRKTAKGMSKAAKVLGAGAFLLLVLGSLGWVYGSSFLTGTLEVALAKQGSIEHNKSVTAVFANEEVLVTASAAGKPDYLVEEGQRVRKGEPIAAMKPEGVTLNQSTSGSVAQVIAPAGGLFYYKTDGMESILTPGNLLAMDLSKALEQSAASTLKSTEGSTGETSTQAAGTSTKEVTAIAQNGGVIGKITNNHLPTVAVVKIPVQGHKLEESLRFLIHDRVYSAKVLRLLDNPQGLVVQFSQYIDGTALQRAQEISWVEKPASEGVILPKSSLWGKGEEVGVYVLQEGIVQFRKVKVIDENEQAVCIEGLPHGISVITNPRSGLDGLSRRG